MPWALLAMVLGGTGGAATLGAVAGPGAPSPAAWVAQLIARTRGAGTARVSYTSLVTNTDPAARTVFSESGAVDFADGNLQAAGTEHSTWQTPGPVTAAYTLHLVQRRVGRTLYLETDDATASSGVEFQTAQWSSVRLPATPGSLFPPDLTGPSLPVLSPDYSAVAVHTVGPASVKGVATTEYRVTDRLDCRVRRGTLQTAPTLLWVDRQGRLVEARERSTYRFTPGTTGGHPSTTTMTELVRLGRFGTPVRVLRPDLRHDGLASRHLIVGSTCA